MQERISNSLSKINTVIKDQDSFGFKIYLNFNKDGDSHKTLIGGLFSILVTSFMVMYTYIRFRMFYYNLADVNLTEIGMVNLDTDPA